MHWEEIRAAYPSRWLVVEALRARTSADDRRHLEDLAVVETCHDGAAAFEAYRSFHRQHPEREFYFVHTSCETLNIVEKRWLGIRGSHAADSAG